MSGKQKKKSKKNIGVEPQLPTLPEMLTAARFATSSEALVAELSRMLCIPDYDTTRGLKHCHDAFDTICSKLEQVFALSRGHQTANVAADTLSAAVLVIYGRMGLDSLLGKRIFAETDFFGKAIPLLHSVTARSIVMPVLSSLMHIGNADIMKDLSRFTSTILDCVEGQSTDLRYAENAVCVLTHCSIIPDDLHSDAELHLPRLIRFILSVIRLPNATSLSFNHFCMFSSNMACRNPATFLDIPDAVDFLVACTRAQDLSARNDALRAVIGLYSREPAPLQEIPYMPEPGRQALSQYGSDPSYQSRSFNFMSRISELLDTFEDSRSLLELGLGLVELILNNASVGLWFTAPDEEYTRLATRVGGTRFVDILRLCGDAVRVSGSGSQTRTQSEILQLEFLAASGEKEEACIVARSCIQRDPSVAFFYYILAAYGDDKSTSVRFAEKGLKCSSLTVFLREELLCSAVLSSDLVIAEMLTGRPSDVRIQELTALLENASLHAISFINDAPPDHLEMPFMISQAILFTLLRSGHALSDDCREIRAPYDKLHLSCDIARSQVGGFVPPIPCLAVEKIFDRMAIANRVWMPVVSRYPSREYSTISSDPNVDLTAWLEKLDISDPVSKFYEIRGLNLATNRYGTAQLPHCSGCGSVSAVLRKCSRCQKTKYCNSDCQRKHWKDHRQMCVLVV
ncbi:hypothetical protein DFH06DRAFT_708099 [Mycena polygramma]|nr:hypothetical protein DFH06DRAFT_708099 [Mycena polygramma]